MDRERKTERDELSVEDLSSEELTSQPERAAPDRAGILLTDVKVHTAIKRFLEREEMRLADVKVRAEINEDSEKTSAGKRAFGNSIVVLTRNENLDRLFEVLETNAAEAAPSDISRRELDAAAQQVLRGESALDSDTAARLLLLLASKDKGQPRSPGEPLTPRQLDVLKLLARGQTNQEIAQELVLSPGTVRTHVQRILAKLRVPDRTAAVVRAIELGLMAPESGA